MKKNIFRLFIIAFLIITGCNSENKNHGCDDHEHTQNTEHEHGEDCEHGEEAHEHNDEHKNEIVFSKQQAKASGLTLETVVPGNFNQVIKTSGQIQGAQADEAVIASTANGIVSFTGHTLTEGSPVKAGQTLVSVSAQKLPDGDPATKARIEYETAGKDYQRASELVKDRIISAKEYEQKRSRYELAKSIYEAQGAHISATGVKLSAPMGGYIKQLSVKQGDYVSVGQPVAVVSQNRRLQLKAEVSEKYFRYLNGVSGANFKTAYDNAVYKLADLNGRLLSYGKTTNCESFYVPVTFEFDNKGDIVPGSFVEVYLLSTPQSNVISVPLSALTEEQGLYFVYIQVDEEGYRKQEVTTGQNNGERIEIKTGLKAGDKVVTHGVYQVKLAAVSSVIPEGHSHSH